MSDSEQEEEAENEGPYLGVYEGDRNEKDERHGHGRCVLPNKDQYDGLYMNGRRDGYGVYKFKNKQAKGARYTGEYFQAKKQGYGIFLYPDGSRYEGYWVHDLKDGTGKYFYVNGDVYDGEWSKGFRHGRGTYTYARDGTKYTGSWRKGKWEGFGELQFANHKYCGRFRDNRMFGHGKYVFDTACELHGQYVITDPAQRREHTRNMLANEAALMTIDDGGGGEMDGSQENLLPLPPSPPAIGPTHWVPGVLTGLHVLTPEEEEEARLVEDLNRLRAKVEAQIEAKKEAARKRAEARAANKARKEAERAALDAQAEEDGQGEGEGEDAGGRGGGGQADDADVEDKGGAQEAEAPADAAEDDAANAGD